MEWTREQWNAAAYAVMERFNGKAKDDAWPVDMQPVDRINRVAIDLQCELTDALTRLAAVTEERDHALAELAKDDTQMGELAVGKSEVAAGEGRWVDAACDLLHDAKHILEDVEMGIDRTIQATDWLDRQRNLSAPPSGEQAGQTVSEEQYLKRTRRGEV